MDVRHCREVSREARQARAYQRWVGQRFAGAPRLQGHGWRTQAVARSVALGCCGVSVVGVGGVVRGAAFSEHCMIRRLSWLCVKMARLKRSLLCLITNVVWCVCVAVVDGRCWLV